MKRVSAFILLLTLVFNLVFPEAFAVTLISDIKGHWAERYINRLIYADVVSGYSDGTFKPDNDINYDEFLTLVLKAKEIDAQAVQGGYWAENVIEKAFLEGYIDQKDADFARPIFRQEMCGVMQKAFDIPQQEGTLEEYTDFEEVSEEYKSAVRNLILAGIVTGDENKKINPAAHLTRAEACAVLENALNYTPEETGEFVQKNYDIKDMPNNGETPFTIFTSSRTNADVSQYSEITEKQDGKYSIFSEAGTVKRAAIYWELDNIENGAMVIPEKDESSTSQKGDLIISFTAPESGNYEFDLSVKNIGTDVFGGGGKGKYTFLSEDDTLDAAIISTVTIPMSEENPKEITDKQIVKLKKGEMVNLRFSVDIDGYGNRFLVDYKVKNTQEEGKQYYNYGLKSYLPQPPLSCEFQGEPFEKGNVYMAVSGYWEKADQSLIEESVRVWKKYFPNIGLIIVKAFPEQDSKAEYFKSEGIPVLVQSYGSPEIYNYYTATDSWEQDWNGRIATPDSGIPLANTGHAAALPSEAVYEAHSRMIQSAARTGYSGYGYQDFVWMWGLGSGESGYNPETIEAFRRDLKKEDEGLKITPQGGETVIWHIDDLAKYYVGAMPEPQDYGYESWDEYYPLTRQEYLQDPDKDYTPQQLLFDLLVGYEWLRTAQKFGDCAIAEGVVSQILPNPEDMGNANDTLIMSGLDSVKMKSEQYMGAAYVDGAYYRMDYLTSNLSPDKSFGVVIEGGSGGNAGGYYDLETAYTTCYEFSSNPVVTHLETDFWVQNHRTIKDNSERSLANKTRYQTLLVSAMAFNDAKEDGLERIEPDFVSVTARRENRPWAHAFKAWSWSLGWRGSPEIALAKNGYVFDSIGEEGVQHLDGHHKVIVYSPEMPAQYHFDKILSMLENGECENIITTGVTLEQTVGYDFKLKDFDEVYPEFETEKQTEVELSGDLTDESGEIICSNITLNGDLYSIDGETVMTLGEIPIVAKRQSGSGEIYIVLFDPDDKDNYDLAVQVYKYLLDNMGIEQHWETVSADAEYAKPRSSNGLVEEMGDHEKDATVRMYENGDLKMVSVQNPLARYFCNAPDMPEGKVYPYIINGNTEVRVKLEPETKYDYISMPSGKMGELESDADGFVNLTLYNTAHELFYILPQSTKSSIRLSEISQRIIDFNEAASADGNIDMEDKLAPAVILSVKGTESDGAYLNSATINFSVTDGEHGSGVKKLYYRIDGQAEKTVVNRSIINAGKIKEDLTIAEKGSHIIYYRTEDEAGNISEEKFLRLTIK